MRHSIYEIARRRVRDFRLRFPNYPPAAAMEDMVMAAIRESAGSLVEIIDNNNEEVRKLAEENFRLREVNRRAYRPGLVGPRPPDPTYDEAGGQAGWAERFIVDGEGGYRRMDIAEMMATQEGMGQS